MNKRISTGVGLVLGLALFFATNILASQGLRKARVDLTEGKLFTLSEGSKRITKGLDEPIRLYLYFSEEAASQIPDLKTYGNRVRELLEAYELAGDGNIVLERVDPERFSEEEDRAVQEGLVGIPQGGDTIYLGLVGTNATDDREVIKFFDPSRERFLEYDVSRMIYTLAHPEKKLVGVLTTLPLEGSPGNPMMGMPPSPGWLVMDQIRQLFDVRVLDTDVDRIPEDVDLLLVIHPRGIGLPARYAIDQYVLRGGKTIVMVDPHCESDRSGEDPSNPMAGMGASKDSDLPELFGAWGFEMVHGKVAADREYALRVTTNAQTGQDMDYVVWLGLRDDAMNREDPVTSLLNQMIVPTAGILRKKEDATTEFEPLLHTSDQAMKVDVGMVQFMPDPRALITQYVPEYETLTLAARVTGNASTAFPDGPPDMSTETYQPEETEPLPPHLPESEQPIQVIVVADADMLADRFWIREDTLFGQISLGYRKTSDNGDFLFNALENLAGGDDLISVRARGQFSRPFVVVDQIRRAAEQQFLDEQQALESKLREAQARINELQREKSGDEALILSPAQEKELESAREEEVATRKRLREVQHGLDKDIESLGRRIKGLNILGLPLLISAAAIALGTWRHRRQYR